MSQGDRGKWAEGKVRDALKKRALQTRFAFLRLPDARAGSFTPTTSDFLVVSNGVPIFLEVKQIDHVFRLGVKSFDQGQRSRMRLFVEAGALARVVVASSQTKLCRLADLVWFESRMTESLSSWDLRSLPERSFESVIGDVECPLSYLTLRTELSLAAGASKAK